MKAVWDRYGTAIGPLWKRCGSGMEPGTAMEPRRTVRVIARITGRITGRITARVTVRKTARETVRETIGDC